MIGIIKLMEQLRAESEEFVDLMGEMSLKRSRGDELVDLMEHLEIKRPFQTSANSRVTKSETDEHFYEILKKQRV